VCLLNRRVHFHVPGAKRLGATLLQHPFERHMATGTITVSEVSKELAPIQRR
jgi:hypothetical protein